MWEWDSQVDTVPEFRGGITSDDWTRALPSHSVIRFTQGADGGVEIASLPVAAALDSVAAACVRMSVHCCWRALRSDPSAVVERCPAGFARGNGKNSWNCWQ